MIVQDLLHHESAVRLAAFAGTLAMVALAESRWPRRLASVSRSARWFNNLALVAMNTLVVRSCLPLLAVGAALAAQERRLGIFNRMEWPSGLAVVLSILALDLTIYFQHRLLHAVRLLWRAHRVHHSDLDFDASTGLRFHPLEIVLSMMTKMGAVVLLGAPAVAVVLFEVLLNATSIFNHANLRLPPRVDCWLRRVMVTPDMHRVHHSSQLAETNSNFGFNFPWWDRLFGTYLDQPAAGHDAMQIGLSEFRDPSDQALWRLLVQPLR